MLCFIGSRSNYQTDQGDEREGLEMEELEKTGLRSIEGVEREDVKRIFFYFSSLT
jgi:hypothetical protein